MSDDISRMRQRLRGLGEKLQRELEGFLSERRGLIRGTFGTRARVCGNPGCRCARGELHVSKYLTASDGGKVRQVHVPSSDEVKVAQGVERYQRWRLLRAEIAALDVELLKLVDALGLALLAEYPPDNPLPAPRKRGRKPKVAVDGDER